MSCNCTNIIEELAEIKTLLITLQQQVGHEPVQHQQQSFGGISYAKRRAEALARRAQLDEQAEQRKLRRQG